MSNDTIKIKEGLKLLEEAEIELKKLEFKADSYETQTYQDVDKATRLAEAVWLQDEYIKGLRDMFDTLTK